jgi:ubiquinone/menaquinone biosynthesis C-methylase UbiE
LRQAASNREDRFTDNSPHTPEEVVAYYSRGNERARLLQGRARLERLRVRQILSLRLPPPPATVLDVGGGAGIHATWLAGLGYEVHLVDPVPMHVEQATAASAAQPEAPLASIRLGDARALPYADESADCVLLFGPLYHLPERTDRLATLGEARRVLRPGGLVAAIAISRYTWLLDGLASGRMFTKPERLALAAHAIETGLLPDDEHEPGPFTTAYLHRPDDLADELREAGLNVDELLGVEGPGWLLQQFNRAWNDDDQRARLLEIATLVESERDLIAASTHLLAVARRG